MNALRQLAVLLLLLGYTQAQSCDFFQNVIPGSTYPIDSPRYPQSYPGGLQCRWTLKAPPNYRVQLNCPEINMPQTTSCSMDRLLVSTSGDSQLYGAEYYCGRGSLSGVFSTGQQLTMGLITAYNTPGGRFSCVASAVPATGTSPTCSCGYKRTNRIVGGETTGVNEYPMMAGIAYSENRAIKCGAVIISNQHVLTAAHCMAGRLLNNTAVVVGEHDTSTGAETSYTRAFAIQSYKIHPNFNDVNYDNDLSIVTVSGVIQFSEFVGPVCLPFKFAGVSFTGAKVTMLGWGTTAFGEPVSRTLQKVTVDVIGLSQCQSSYPSVTARQICTYTPGKDSCQDDSGGPVLFYDRTTGREFNIGLVSFGRTCAGPDPGVSTRITAYLTWIEQNTPAELCRVA